MIILQTGQNGAGKTANIVDLLAHDPQYQNRPLFVMGIPELKIPHQPVPPIAEWTEHRPSEEDPSVLIPWFTFPPNSLIVIDECQSVFRPRAATSKVPYVEMAFETHRRVGLDFILLTPHPNLISAHVRRLVGRHYHIHISSLKRELLEWNVQGGGDPDSPTSRGLAQRRDYKPPKRVFELYKSAEAHTKIKKKIPRAVYVVAVCALLAVIFTVFAVSRLKSRVSSDGKEQTATASQPGRSPDMSRPAESKPEKMTIAEWLANRQPRLPGLAHTAPVYDEVTKPVDAPIPVGCVQNHKSGSCRCMDQQGNDYKTTPAVCQQVVENGMFIDWRQPQATPLTPPQAAAGGAREGKRTASPAHLETVSPSV